jgi:hypothetical protein
VNFTAKEQKMKLGLTCLAFCLLFSTPFLSRAQTVKEEIFPKLPYRNVSSSIAASSTGFYINGTSWEEGTGWPVYDSYRVARPYFILSPDRVDRKALLLPETESIRSWVTAAEGNSIYFSSTTTTADSFFVVWHNVREVLNDMEPTILYADPTIHLARQDQDSLLTILTYPRGWFPSMASEADQSLHLVWENVTQVDSMWSSSLFYKYSATIVYRKRSGNGRYSDSVEIGKGFFPTLKVRDGNLHVIFFAADSSNQQTMSISYARLSRGTFSSPTRLEDVRVNPSPYGDWPYWLQLSNLQWDLDASGGVHLVWRDPYEGSRWHIVHYSVTVGVQVDSVDVANPQFRFMDDGSIKVLSAVERIRTDSTDFQFQISTPGRPVQKIRTLSFAPRASLTHILVDTSGNEHAVFTVGSQAYLLQHVTTDSARIVPLVSGYVINSTSFVTKDNQVWLTGKRDSTNVILHFSLSDVVVSVEKNGSIIPGRFVLYQNYPNPFNPSTTISYDLPARSHVTLKIFNLLGQEVATLVDGDAEAGRHLMQWNAGRLASGVYFYRLQAGKFVENKKMILLK